MTAFPTAGHLASWAGVCPGANESAGRVKSTKTREGNRNLKGALGIAALSATRSRDTYFAAKYRRICAHRGPMKALVAVERAMVVAAHGMLTNGDFYRDPGANYFTARRPGPSRPTRYASSKPSDTPSPSNQPPRSPELNNRRPSPRQDGCLVMSLTRGGHLRFRRKDGAMSIRYDENTKARAVRLVREHRDDYDSEWAAMKAISGRLGMNPETLRKWVRQAEIDAGEAAGVSSEERRELRELRRKNRELEQTIEILKAATSFFARECDPRHR